MIEASLLDDLSWNSFKSIDIQVSTKCKYLLETKDQSNQSDMTILSDELQRKKQDYFKDIQVIIKYREEWVKEMQENIYIELDHICGLDDEIKKNINITADLSKFVQKQLTTIFENVNHENNSIVKEEYEISTKVITKICENFEVGLNFKIMSNFYNQEQFENFYKKLVKHSVNSFKKNFDYKSDQNSFLIKCENKLITKLNNQKSIIHSKYTQNMKDVLEHLRYCKSRSIILFKDQLITYYPDNFYKDRNEFLKSYNDLTTQTISSMEEKMRKNNTYFNEDFYNKLIDKNINQLIDEIQQISYNYSLKEKKIHPDTRKVIQNQQKIHPHQSSSGGLARASTHAQQSSPSSIVILFGKVYNHSVCVKHNSSGEKDEIIAKPNCIRFYDNVLIGQAAKEVAPKDDFDVKDLLFIRHMKETQKREIYAGYPFEINLDNMVKYRAINKDLSIESLIALQVLDIKSETEKRVNTNVTNAVFIVPINYTIRQFEDFRNVGKLSGFNDEQVNIISQINCAAIGFAEKMRLQKKNYFENVLIISLNEYECDSAVLQINDYNINYKSFLNRNLITNTNKRFIPIETKEKNLEHKMIINFRRLIEETVGLSSKQNKASLDFIIVSGLSTFISNIKQYLNENFKFKNNCNYDSFDVIMEGAEYHARSLEAINQNKIYKFQEIIKHDTIFSLKFQIKFSALDKNKIILNSNTFNLLHSISNVKRNIDEFTMEIKFYQDDCVVGCFFHRNTLVGSAKGVLPFNRNLFP